WRCNAEQAEGEPMELPVATAPVVTLPDRGEELIRAERKRADNVDLIKEDDHAPRGVFRVQGSGFSRRYGFRVGPARSLKPEPRKLVRQHALLQGGHEATEGSEPGVLDPETLQLLFEAHLLADVGEESLVPLLRCE